MFKLLASIKKELLLLSRDKVGLALMFVMPIVLAILIAAIQNNTFKLVNENRIDLVLLNKDSAKTSGQFVHALYRSGMFQIHELKNAKDFFSEMEQTDALAGILIPVGFSASINKRSEKFSNGILADLGLNKDTLNKDGTSEDSLLISYSPVLQESFRQSIRASVLSCLQLVENKLLIEKLYNSVSEKKTSGNVEELIFKNESPMREITANRYGLKVLPNATQHNIPAWTIFAMFFIVISLGSNVVKEKLNGSFLRLRTLPSSYLLSLFSKQVTYLAVALLQVVVIFTIGIFLFPKMGLPKLNLPSDLFALLFVSLICGWCAVSYAIAVGVFANTQEQANGFGAVSIVILAALGGLLVPSFVMPKSLSLVMKLSPLHWCLESYYGLFLEQGKLKDITANILPLLAIILLLQLIAFWGLKRKNLI